MYRTAIGAHPPRWVRLVAPVCGVFTFLIALVVLVGWVFTIPELTTWVDGWASMKFNTAVMTAVAGLWLMVPRHRWTAVTSLAVAMPMFALSIAMIAEWVTHRSLGIDTMLWPVDVPGSTYPGRTSLQASAAFAVFALVIGLAPYPHSPTRQVGVCAALGFAYTAFAIDLAYLYGAQSLTGQRSSTGVSLAAALALVLLAAGVVSREARHRPLRWLWESSAAGSFTRRMMPLVVAVPVTLGLVELWLVESGGVDPRPALALSTLITVLVPLVVIVDTVRVVARTEDARARASLEVHAVLDSIPAPISMRSLDGTILRANPLVLAARDLRPEEMEGHLFSEFYPADLVTRVDAQGQRVIESLRPETMDVEVTQADGTTHQSEFTQFPVLDPMGIVIGLGAIALDVTERRKAEASAQRAAQQLNDLLNSAPDATIVVSDDGTITYLNSQVTALLGYTDAELLGQTVDTLVPLGARGRHDALRSKYSSAPVRRPMGAGLALTARHKDGREIPVEISLGPLATADGQVTVAAIRDVTQKRAAEQALRDAEMHYRHLAEHDPLTGLANRRRLSDALEELAANAPGTGALLALDLDHFKSVNDRFGHEAGDQLLIQVAQALGRETWETDTLARIGGDEFVILCPTATREEAAGLADRLVDVVREVAEGFGEAGVGVTASVGVVAMADLDIIDRTSKVAMLRADLALYAAKSHGRARAEIFSKQV